MRDTLVVDLSDWLSGPYCTKLLADYGARVIKVEGLAGDPARRMGPFPDDAAIPEGGGLFLHLNTNKQSVAVDLSKADGIEIVRALAARADVVVESSAPEVLAGMGLAAKDMIAAKPDLVVTSVTGFGQSGPYKDWQISEIVAFAMGGPMNASGIPGREPVKLVGNVVQMQSGATACTATLGALFWARTTGVGQHVDVATFETQNGSLDRRRYNLLSYEYSSTVGERAPVVGAGRPGVGGRFMAADGIELTTGRIWPDHVARMVTVLGDARLAALWGEHGLAIMSDYAPIVDDAIGRWVSQRPSRQAMRQAQAGGWPVVVVNDPLKLLSDDHFVARHFWRFGHHPVAGNLPYTGPPWRLDGDGDGWALRRTAPRLGQDTDAVLADVLDISQERIAELRTSGTVR